MNAAASVCVCRCTAESWGKCCHYPSWFVLSNLDLFLAICVSQESPFFSEDLIDVGKLTSGFSKDIQSINSLQFDQLNF